MELQIEINETKAKKNLQISLAVFKTLKECSLIILALPIEDLINPCQELIEQFQNMQ